MDTEREERNASSDPEKARIDGLFLDHQISLETVVKLLVRKGILRPEELAAEEEAKRALELRQHAEFVWNLAEHKARETRHSHRGYRRPRSWLKRVMARRRWTRRLGTFLFGWKWKKTSHRNHRERAPAEL